jgi:hypothetical protein
MAGYYEELSENPAMSEHRNCTGSWYPCLGVPTQAKSGLEWATRLPRPFRALDDFQLWYDSATCEAFFVY